MMGLIVNFVSGTIGKVLVGGGVFLAAWLFIKVKYENQGAAKERAKIVEAGGKNARTAARIRAKVQALPDDQLFDHYTRD